MQLSLLAGVRREARPKPWKRVRPTSVAVYAELRDSGKLAAARNRALRAVAALKNSRGEWPTACEVQAWLLERKEVEDANPNRVKPRLTELATGWHVTLVREVNGVKVKERVHVPCDVLEQGPKRKSRVSGISCITWQVKERQ